MCGPPLRSDAVENMVLTVWGTDSSCAFSAPLNVFPFWSHSVVQVGLEFTALNLVRAGTAGMRHRVQLCPGSSEGWRPRFLVPPHAHGAGVLRLEALTPEGRPRVKWMEEATAEILAQCMGPCARRSAEGLALCECHLLLGLCSPGMNDLWPMGVSRRHARGQGRLRSIRIPTAYYVDPESTCRATA